MIKIFRAVKSEHRKLWSKRSSFAWIMLCLIFSVIFVFILNSASANGNQENWTVQNGLTGVYGDVSDWDKKAENEIKALEMSIHQMETRINAAEGIQKVLLGRELQQMKRQMAINSYRLDNNIRPDNEYTWGIMRMSLWVMAQIAAAVTVCAASDMFGGEYSRGTIYMNLARPVTRIKQYTAKLITASVYAALLMLACFIGTLAAGALLGETDGIYVGFINGEAYHKSWLGHIFEIMLCCWAMIEMCVAICAAAGTLTRSRTGSAVTAIVIMIVSLYFGSVIGSAVGIVSGFSLIACMDLTAPLAGSLNHPDVSFNECVISLGAHFMLFCCAGYNFMRKDIG